MKLGQIQTCKRILLYGSWAIIVITVIIGIIIGLQDMIWYTIIAFLIAGIPYAIIKVKLDEMEKAVSKK